MVLSVALARTGYYGTYALLVRSSICNPSTKIRNQQLGAALRGVYCAHASRRGFWWGGDSADGKGDKGNKKGDKEKEETEGNGNQCMGDRGVGDRTGEGSSGHIGDKSSSKAEAQHTLPGDATSSNGKEELPPMPTGSSPMLLGAMDQAPRQPRLIGLPITRRPLFPTTAHPYTITNPDVLEAVVKAHQDSRPYVGVFLRKDDKGKWSREEDGTGAEGGEGQDLKIKYPEVISSLDEIHHVGTLAQVIEIRPSNLSGEAQVLLLGHRRLSIDKLITMGPPMEVDVDHWSRGTFEQSDVIRAYCQEIVSTVRDVVNLNPLLRDRITFFSERNIDIHDPFKLSDLAAIVSGGESEEMQAVLAERGVDERLRLALEIISKEREVLQLQLEIKQQVEEKMTSQKRTYFLQEQLKSIKKELGLEKDDKEALLNKYRKRLAELKEITKEGERAIGEELEKLSSLEKNSPEFNGTKSYLEWLTLLPWGHASTDNYDLGKAKEGLDQDHYGLDDIKDRILEFIAVGKLKGGVHGKIVCFVGPPGVGKTSIGKSIAKALDREFYRFSVGGLRDVAEIKGHRRTYVGAMPGKLIQCLKTTGTNNPVVLIDEVDKIGKGYEGDPASALLEVLDPSQNQAFLDNYLDVPVDLSNCLFICTANVMDTVPGPLKDRMEVIRLSGYDLPEKVAISEQYLIPKAQHEHGMDKEGLEGRIKITTEAIESLARWYAREAGVRNLSKLIDKVHRKLALEIVREDEGNGREGKINTESEETEVTEGAVTVDNDNVKTGNEGEVKTVGEGEGGEDEGKQWLVTVDNLQKYVGMAPFTSDRLYEGELPPGVVMGLAWTSMGGSSLYIEAMSLQPHVEGSTEGDGEQGGKRRGGGGGRIK
ncbi:unnamed protein product, partial [Choristocarpus tenellus]